MKTTFPRHPGRPPAGDTVDTRAPGGPEGRVYAVAFARVWDELVRLIRSRSRWSLVHGDEELGLMTVTCPSYVPGRVDDLTIWVRLDVNGLTRLDLRCAPGSRRDFGLSERRIRDLLQRLDRALGTAARIRD